MRIEESAFDSQFYGCKIGRVHEFDPDGMDARIAEARRDGFAMVLVRVEAEGADRRAVEARGYEPLETLVTSRLGVARAVDVRHVDVSSFEVLDDPAAISQVEEITRTSFTTSHLHRDSRLPIEATRRLYAAWARNDVTGRAQRTFVALQGRDVSGYLTVVRTSAAAVIDLIAVSSHAQNRGIGSQLIAAFIAWVDRQGLEARVGTQLDNPALALYKRMGFEPFESHVTYHLWLS